VTVDAEAVTEPHQRFAEFFVTVEPRLRRALVAARGAQAGREATADALAWAWEHQERLEGLRDPVGYLYRVAQSQSRRRKVRPLAERPTWSEPWIEPALAGALNDLPERQRVAVVLVHGYAWTHAEVAELLGVAATTVQNHVERGLRKLQRVLEGDDA
jgi:RNA polymerase sigma factor (sigma-70 family)